MIEIIRPEQCTHKPTRTEVKLLKQIEQYKISYDKFNQMSTEQLRGVLEEVNPKLNQDKRLSNGAGLLACLVLGTATIAELMFPSIREGAEAIKNYMGYPLGLGALAYILASGPRMGRYSDQRQMAEGIIQERTKQQ